MKTQIKTIVDAGLDHDRGVLEGEFILTNGDRYGFSIPVQYCPDILQAIDRHNEYGPVLAPDKMGQWTGYKIERWDWFRDVDGSDDYQITAVDLIEAFESNLSENWDIVAQMIWTGSRECCWLMESVQLKPGHVHNPIFATCLLD